MPLSSTDEATVQKHSFHIKFDHQLEAMLVSHTSKRDRLREPGGDLEKYTQDADGMAAVRWDLKQQNLDMSVAELEQEFFDQQAYYIWKDSVLDEVVKILPVEIDARETGKVKRKPVGTTFYIDATNGTNSYSGTKITGTIDSSADSTHFVDAALTGADDYINGSFFYNQTTGAKTLILDFIAGTDTVELTDADGSMAAGDTYYILHAWADLDQFTENARSAGDKVILRRDMTGYDDGTDLNFTSDGTKADPISITADNANEWKDDVDLSATATATLTFGSKTITFSADVSGVIAANDVIYVAAEDADEFAYEVDAVSTVTVTLFLPYKGNQAGSGKTMTNMQGNPVWNTAAGNFQWNFDNDHMWKVQGIHIRGTDPNGNVELDSSLGHIFMDCIFEGNDAADNGIDVTDDGTLLRISKSRFYNHVKNLDANFGDGGVFCVFRDCLFDGNSLAGSEGFGASGQWDHITAIDCEFKNHQAEDIDLSGAKDYSHVFLRNCILSSTTQIRVRIDTTLGGTSIFSEDHDGSLNVSAQYNGFGPGTNTPIIDSDTGTLRSGGGAISGKCTPSTNLSSNWEISRQLLFEIPFYATTSSKKYEVFFRPTATADWTDDPTNVELWIELEYWGHATNNFRRITKSTGVVDMNGSTTFTALDVTVAPAQAGVAYLRGYYAKTKESGKANTFFWDVVPVVT